MAEYTMTQRGLEKLKEELRKLKEEKRPAVIARIKGARELGDLAENADYQDAREEQAFIEGRIQELESMIKDARVVDERDGNSVGVGATVTVKKNGEAMTLVVVGPSEADPAAGSISNQSPLGRALMGHKAGDVVGVETPDGIVEYKIVAVQ